jgi:hypothetical protein
MDILKENQLQNSDGTITEIQVTYDEDSRAEVGASFSAK